MQGSKMGVIKGDTGSSDYSSCEFRTYSVGACSFGLPILTGNVS